ncbi:MAG TPA: sporulation protein YqfC [Syntrophomonadaceae bacterium]|nr:sporulation protein YqfC [Syntrophomonadaceae bacterium]
MSKRREAIGRTVADMLEIPRDLVFDLPRVTLVGRNELHIENHRGVIEFNPDRMRINLSRGYMEIEGQGLEIDALMPEEISIRGEIYSLKYMD